MKHHHRAKTLHVVTAIGPDGQPCTVLAPRVRMVSVEGRSMYARTPVGWDRCTLRVGGRYRPTVWSAAHRSWLRAVAVQWTVPTDPDIAGQLTMPEVVQ